MDKYITVCFHRGEGFGGREYDFKLAKGEKANAGDVIRLISSDKKWLYSAGRVQVQRVSDKTSCPADILKTVYTIESSADEEREDFLKRKDALFAAKFKKGE